MLGHASDLKSDFKAIKWLILSKGLKLIWVIAKNIRGKRPMGQCPATPLSMTLVHSVKINLRNILGHNEVKIRLRNTIMLKKNTMNNIAQ